MKAALTIYNKNGVEGILHLDSDEEFPDAMDMATTLVRRHPPLELFITKESRKVFLIEAKNPDTNFLSFKIEAIWV